MGTYDDWADVEWSAPVEIQDLDQLDPDFESDLYAIIGAVDGGHQWTNIRLLYIGSAYRQHVIDRIRQDHEAYESIEKYLAANPRRVLLVKSGSIVDSSLERTSEKFVRDIECCLIYCNQPSCNRKCKESSGARAVHVRSFGDHKPIKRDCDCT